MRRFAVLVLAASVVSGCEQRSETAGTPATGTPASSRETAGTPATAADGRLARLQACAKAEVAIERLRKAEGEPDWKAITAQLELCSFLVQEADTHHGLGYAAAIRDALKRCQGGDRPKVHQQVLAKGLQHAAVLAIQRELDGLAAADPAERQRAVRRAAAVFEGIRPTFIRRDQDFFKGSKTLEASADSALAALGKAASSGAAAAIAPRRELEQAIARTYALSVLYEIQGIEKLRQTDRGKCDVKLKEAEIFYAILRPRLQQKAPDADAALMAMLGADYTTFSADAARAQLRKGLPDVEL